jgi:cytochrome c oxidase cbb3-type subunit 4
MNANNIQAVKEKKMNPGGYVIYTVVLLLAFVSIAIWAFGKNRKSRFSKDARIPFEEDLD